MSGVEFKGVTYEIDEETDLATGRMFVGDECIGFSLLKGMTRESLQKEFDAASDATWILKGAYSFARRMQGLEP